MGCMKKGVRSHEAIIGEEVGGGSSLPGCMLGSPVDLLEHIVNVDAMWALDIFLLPERWRCSLRCIDYIDLNLLKPWKTALACTFIKSRVC